MKRLTTRLLLLAVLLLAGLAGCGGNSPAAEDPNLVYTQIWQTVEFAQTQTVLLSPPTATLTLTPLVSLTPEPSNTPLVSSTPAVSLATSTPLVRVTPPGSGSQTACDNGILLEDVTYPDGTVVNPGQSFIKTWRFENTGPCAWDDDYHLIFGWQSGGTNWNTLAPVPFNTKVEVGETLEISVTLTAPTTPGGYGAWFRLQNDKGFNFGEIFAVYVVVE